MAAPGLPRIQPGWSTANRRRNVDADADTGFEQVSTGGPS